MAQLEACFAEETSVRELPDLGGGPRSIIESVFSLKSYSGGLDHGKYTLSKEFHSVVVMLGAEEIIIGKENITKDVWFHC